jgi:hypothetical protein
MRSENLDASKTIGDKQSFDDTRNFQSINNKDVSQSESILKAESMLKALTGRLPDIKSIKLPNSKAQLHGIFSKLKQCNCEKKDGEHHTKESCMRCMLANANTFCQ